MKHILLVAINAKYIHSNLAVYCLKAYAGEYEDNVSVAEYTINNRVDDILDDIYTRKPDMIGFSCYIWNIEYIKKLIVEIHKLLPQCRIWLGGPEVSYNTDYYIDNYDFLTGIMVGEGEATFKEVVERFVEQDSIDNNADDYVSEKESVYKISSEFTYYDNIPGICTRNIRKPVARACIDMSDIPFLYKDIKNFENRIIYYESSRGCPFSCSYCLSSIDRKLRFRDILLVEKELSFFLEHKVPQVKFVDRTFNCDRERSLRIWKYIMEHDNFVTNFHFEISADLLTDEQIEVLNNMRPGLVQLEIGVQTTNETTVKAIRRKMDIKKLKEVVNKINKPQNIHLHLDLIAGLPFEDITSFRKSFNDVYNMKPDELQLGFLKVLYGSYMYDDAKKYEITYREYPPYEVLQTKWLSYDDILSLKKLEEVLEIYFGSGQFKQSVSYLLEFFDTPYDFYNKLGEFCFNNSKKSEKHSRIERYNILRKFALEICIENKSFDMEILDELMTFDIYIRENIKTRPPFARDRETSRDVIKNVTFKYDIHKTDHIEEFSEKTVKRIFGNNEKGRFICFNYRDRNPVDYNAKIKHIDF